MSTKDTTPSSICRIIGLQSVEGKKRNESAARVKTFFTSSDSTRHPVSIDGFPGPMSIKTSNLRLIQPQSELSVGVGRGTFLDDVSQAALIYQDQVVERSFVQGGAARSRGNLEAMELFISKQMKRVPKPILIKLTDLNIARAMNRVAAGDETVKLAQPLNQRFQKLKKKLLHQEILVKFESHRISEDRFEVKHDKLGPQRLKSGSFGSYQIYPCALKQYLDAMEVRYVDLLSDRKDVVIHHEIYLDYGAEEACMYAKHAVAMGESHRIFPAVLAEVDPQAFWNALLWLNPFLETLQTLDLPSNLMEEWKKIEAGKTKSHKYHVDSMASFGHDKASLKGPEEQWAITKSQDVHLRIATDYAIGAIVALQHAILEHKPPSMKSMRLHTLDYYIGTELDNYINGVSNFHEMARQEGVEALQDGERSAKLFNRAMKSAGFKRDSKYRIDDPEKVCDNCGERSKKKLMTCARCEGVSYCDAKCQKAHWKKHKPNCSRVLVQLQKQMANLKIKMPDIDVEIASKAYDGSSSLPPGPAMISECSGIGMMSIFWNPGSTSFISIANESPFDIASGAVSLDAAAAGNRNTIQFSDFSQLHPTQRFLICCGPLPQLEIARQCASEAIRSCDGRLDELRVPNVGFTALEWAAKKGNMDIVKWLCTDDRTKALVKIGSPVGWAGYTGKVEIMRYLLSQGADPASTDAVLWGGTAPLLVAAQNGQLESMKFFVDECKQDIRMKDSSGKDILKQITGAPNWRELKGHKAAHKWAKKLLQK